MMKSSDLLKRKGGFFWGISLLWSLSACSLVGTNLPRFDPTATTGPVISSTPTATVTLPASITVAPPTLTSTVTPFVTRTAQPPLTVTPSPQACLQRGGEMQITEMPVEILAEPLSYRVYLPPCYQENLQSRYPALYLIHGQYFNDDQWDRLGIDETADRLILAAEIPPLIIVMPRDRLWNQPERDPFGQAILEALVPTIDAQYRTRSQREFRAIGGLSRGGSWALHLGVQSWQTFSAVGAHSAAIFWDDASNMRIWLRNIPADAMPRFFIDLGDSDRPEISHSALGFEDLLTRLRIAHEFYLFVGDHNEDYWRTHIEQYLRWYAAAWKNE